MQNRLPQITLALLLVVAAAVMLGGAALSPRTETVRVPRDRAPLRAFATAVDEQVRRLERLYESHLREIAEAVEVRNAASSRSACERIVGIRQLSILHGASDRETDQHVIAMKPAFGEKWPEPALRDQQGGGLPRAILRLPESMLLADRSERSGWFDQPGQELIFWVRRDWENVAIVLSLDRAEIAEAVDRWLRGWFSSGASGAFAGVETSGGPDRLLGTHGAVLG
ncbi:MAG TPA: hypothetical protein VFD27_02000, partial [Chthoniobacteraceae bacterium]|nr:hypothetical protein [Chthoniobacteraceae bacterium]